MRPEILELSVDNEYADLEARLDAVYWARREASNGVGAETLDLMNFTEKKKRILVNIYLL